MKSAVPTRVLAIDDDSDICLYIQEILERNNCVVSLAERGRDALRLLAAERFDIVMADVRLPDLDGVSILEHVRLSGSDIPFVLITGFTENEPIINSMRLGAVDYITKPFTPSDLEKSLHRALERKKRLDWSRHLYQIAEHQDLPLHEKIQKILLLTADLLGMDSGLVIRSSTEGQALSFSSGRTETELESIREAWQQHLTLRLSAIQKTRDLSFHEGTPVSWAAIPLCLNAQVQGAVCFFRKAERLAASHDIVRSALQLTELSISRLLEGEDHALTIANQQDLILASQNLSHLGALTPGIVHEIENQLNVIADRTVLVEKMLQTDAAGSVPRIQGTLASIGSDVKRIDRLVKMVRTISRKEDGSEQELLQLRAVLDEALELFRCQLHARPVRLTIADLSPQYYIRGNPTQILQVFLILLNNSLDAIEGMAAEWIQIDAGIRHHSLQITITDSGRGIPPHLHDKIFVPFYTTKSAGKGLGVGLSLARRHMEAHHGKIWVDPQSPHTRFILQFTQVLDATGKAAGL
jgi:signal transduction histidine kinase/FixJ family two-component response regulator